MLRLDSPLRSIQIQLESPVTSAQLQITASYSDKTATTYDGGTQLSMSNDTTAVVICNPPAPATTRDVDSITIYNLDTAPANATVLYSDADTTYILFKGVLAVGDQLVYSHAQSWKVLDSSGSMRNNVGSSGKSAYEIYYEHTKNTGTALNEANWLASLKGETGQTGGLIHELPFPPERVGSGGVPYSYYINYFTGEYYEKSASLGWAGQEPIGVVGQFATGHANNIIYKEGVPESTEGVDGDFYVDTAGYGVYGPKTSGAWGEPFLFTPYAINQGETAPTNGYSTLGNIKDGDYYIDTTSQTLWGPMAAGTFVGTTGLVLKGQAATDSILTDPQEGQVLTYDASISKWVNKSAVSTIAGAKDVDIADPKDGQCIKYDLASGKWVNFSPNYAPIDKPSFTNGIESYGSGAVASNFIAGSQAAPARANSGANNVIVGSSAGNADYACSDNVLLGAESGKLLSSGIVGYTIVNGGSGYVTGATATISAPDAGGVQATATVSVSGGAISSLLPNVIGTKYSANATVTINPIGGGIGAVVTPVVSAGSYNTVIGSQALKNSTSAYEQVAIGYRALYSHTTQGSNLANVAVGTRAMTSSASTSATVAVGYESGKALSGGTSNTILGCQAGKTGTALNSCTLVGASAGANTTANYVTAVGANAGGFSGTGNTFLGTQSGFLNSGLGVTAIGSYALATYGNGSYDVAIGESSQNKSTTGSYNSSLGYQTLLNNLVGNYSTAIGYKALTLATAGSNTALGYNAGASVTTGTNLTLIGCGATPSSPTAANEVTLGDSSVTTLRCAATSITSLSDARDKKNFRKLPVGLDFINSLNPVTFEWNARDGSKVGTLAAGFVAQDLYASQREFFAEYLGLVSTTDPERWEAAYGNLIAPMVKAIQELSYQNQRLTYRIALLETSNERN